MRVLISGGGIAGLTLAYWLHRYGIAAVVIEQSPSLRRDGYGLDFYGTGYDVAERMGVLEQLREQRLPFEDIAYVDARGRRIAHLSMDLLNTIMQNRYMELMHSTLEEVLYDAVADAVEIRHGTTLVAISAEAEGVSVAFHDGSTDSFDLLIGADGVHSNVRRLVFGDNSRDDARHERYLGYYFASYPLVDRYGIGHGWKSYIEAGRWASAYCGKRDGELVAFFMYKATNEGYIAREQRLSRLRQVFAGMGWITQQLLEDVADPESILLDSMTQIEMPCWHRGRVVLVGDACACPTSLSGQGASMAMGGAYILAEALHTIPDYASAFRSYEQRVRPHVERRQKTARSLSKTFLPESPLELVMQRLILKLFLRETWSGLLRRQFGVESMVSPQDAHQSDR